MDSRTAVEAIIAQDQPRQGDDIADGDVLFKGKTVGDRGRNGKDAGPFQLVVLAIQVGLDAAAAHVDQLKHARVGMQADVPVEQAGAGLDILDVKKLRIFQRWLFAVERIGGDTGNRGRKHDETGLLTQEMMAGVAAGI